VNTFDAWSLPGEMIDGLVPRKPVSGASVRRLDLLQGHLTQIAHRVRQGGEGLRGRSSLSIAEALGSIGVRFRDPSDVLRLEALSALPETSGLSSEMAELVLDGMCRDWTTEVFLEVLRREFGDAEALDRAEAPGGTAGLITHIGSGTVPGVTATSLIRSLLVKSPALVKPGLGDVVLPVLWARAIHAADPALGEALAVIYWPGSDHHIRAEAIELADLVVVYGADDTIAEVRTVQHKDQSVVAYPHRVGLCGLGRESLTPEGMRERAREAALAVATFDQRGCVSPHVIYVEEGGAVTPAHFAEILAEELAELEEKLPSGKRSIEDAIVFQQLKGTLELRAASGEAVVVFSDPGGPWAVVLDADPSFRPSCLGRFVWVKSVGDLSELPALLEPVREHLQTVALEVDPARQGELDSTLRRLGASRITSLKDAPWPRAWWRHDGNGPLRILRGCND